MTGVAIIRRRDVAGRFTGGYDTVVTTDAGTLYLIVIHPRHRHPGRRRVASLAHIGSGNVRHAFADRCGAIVAANAGIRRGAVIEHRDQPINGGVARLASRHGGNVRGRFTNGDDAIVAGFASPRDLSMIHQWTNR